MGWQLDLMILEVFSTCNDSMVLWLVGPGESHQLPERQWGLGVSRSETYVSVCVCVSKGDTMGGGCWGTKAVPASLGWLWGMSETIRASNCRGAADSGAHMSGCQQQERLGCSGQLWGRLCVCAQLLKASTSYICVDISSLMDLHPAPPEKGAADAACVHLSVSVRVDLSGQPCICTRGVCVCSVCMFLLETLLVGPRGMELQQPHLYRAASSGPTSLA